jgi:diguanylate cyclase
VGYSICHAFERERGSWSRLQFERDRQLSSRVLSKLVEFARHKGVQVTALTVAGTLGCLVLSLSLQFLLLGGANAPTFRRSMVLAVALPLLFVAPLLFLLGLQLKHVALLRQRYAEELAHDSLTSCLNGALFSAAVDVYPTLVGSRSGRRKGAVLVIDVDRLRTLNDRVGRRAGDYALSTIADVIRQSVRSGDIVGRIGGDEFAVFLPGATRENAEKIAERIRNTVVEVAFKPGGTLWPLSVSVGAVLFEAEIQLDDLLRVADRQMREAKEKGGNRIEYTQFRQDPSQSRPSLH